MIIKPKWLRNSIAIILGYLSISNVVYVISWTWSLTSNQAFLFITIFIFSFAIFLLSLFGLITGN